MRNPELLILTPHTQTTDKKKEQGYYENLEHIEINSEINHNVQSNYKMHNLFNLFNKSKYIRNLRSDTLIL